MLLKRIEETEQHLRQFIGQHFGVELKRLTVETPPRTEFGDLAFPFSFELAKTLRRSPREIALQVAENIEAPPHVDRFVAAGNGHLNVFFQAGRLLSRSSSLAQQPLGRTLGREGHRGAHQH